MTKTWQRNFLATVKCIKAAAGQVGQRAPHHQCFVLRLHSLHVYSTMSELSSTILGYRSVQAQAGDAPDHVTTDSQSHQSIYSRLMISTQLIQSHLTGTQGQHFNIKKGSLFEKLLVLV